MFHQAILIDENPFGKEGVFLVIWNSLFILLSKCMTDGCVGFVLPEDMETTKDGI